MKLTEKKTWEETIKGIPVRIVYWTTEHLKNSEHRDLYPFKGIWNSYILIRRQNIPDKFDELIPAINEHGYPSGIIKSWNYFEIDNKFFNMAYGATFYGVKRDEFTGEIWGIEIGNDYNHIWNENQYIDEKTIKRDLEQSIDTFIQVFPEYVVWNSIDGKYITPTDLLALTEKHNAQKTK